MPIPLGHAVEALVCVNPHLAFQITQPKEKKAYRRNIPFPNCTYIYLYIYLYIYTCISIYLSDYLGSTS